MIISESSEPCEEVETHTSGASEDTEEMEDNAHGKAAADAPAAMTAAQLFARRQEKLAENKAAIALYSSQLMEDPEGNVNSYNGMCACVLVVG